MSKIELIQGDCLEEMSDISGKFIIVSDPPFNIGYKYKSYKDNKKEDEYYEWLYKIFGNNPQVLIHYPESLYKYSFQSGMFPNKVISWVYNSNTGKQHRLISWWGCKPDFRKIRQPYKNLNDKRIKARIAAGKTGAKLYDWWEINQVKNVSKEKTAHPCQIPEEVIRRIILITAKPNDVIIDVFGGSGTTSKVANELRFDTISYETDETYCDIMAERVLFL